MRGQVELLAQNLASNNYTLSRGPKTLLTVRIATTFDAHPTRHVTYTESTPNSLVGKRKKMRFRGLPEPWCLEEADPGCRSHLPTSWTHTPPTIPASLPEQFPGEDGHHLEASCHQLPLFGLLPFSATISDSSESREARACPTLK